MNYLYIILYVFIAFEALSIALYIPRISFWFEGLKKQKKLLNPYKSKFAIIIPARNESKSIPLLLYSLNSQTYNKELYDVHIVVADKDDQTINIAKTILHNPKIHIVENQTRKAEALDGCIKSILNNEVTYDDYIIVDADCILDCKFLEEMNNAKMSGADIIIPRKRVKNWESMNKKNRNIWSNCSGMTYVGVDAMGNKSKSKRNYTLALCGQGMLIRGKIIEKLAGYPFRCLIEDYEISVECIRNDYKQFYYEYAELYSEEPITRKEFNKRRIRWIQGFAQFTKRYNQEIKNITFKQGKIKKENLFFLYGLIPVYMMFSACFIVSLTFFISFIVMLITHNPSWSISLLFSLIPIVISYMYLFIYAIIQLCEDNDVNKMTKLEKIKFAIFYPLITLEYTWIFIAAFTIKQDSGWAPVERIDM